MNVAWFPTTAELNEFVLKWVQPGDVVTTGTPPGVGLGQNPQIWLNEGDRVSLGIAGLGEQHQTVIAA